MIKIPLDIFGSFHGPKMVEEGEKKNHSPKGQTSYMFPNQVAQACLVTILSCLIGVRSDTKVPEQVSLINAMKS